MFPRTREPRPKAKPDTKKQWFDEMDMPTFVKVITRWKNSAESRFPNSNKARIRPLFSNGSPALFNQRCYEKGWELAIMEMREFLRRNNVPRSVLEILPPLYPGYRKTRLKTLDVDIIEAQASTRGNVAFTEGYRRAEKHYIKVLKENAKLASAIPTGDMPTVKREHLNRFKKGHK